MAHDSRSYLHTLHTFSSFCIQYLHSLTPSPILNLTILFHLFSFFIFFRYSGSYSSLTTLYQLLYFDSTTFLHLSPPCLDFISSSISLHSLLSPCIPFCTLISSLSFSHFECPTFLLLSLPKIFRKHVWAILLLSSLLNLSSCMYEQDVLTRWNSTFYMIERFLLLRQFPSTVLIKHAKGPPMVTASEIETLTEIIAILKPLEWVTREISGEKYVTRLYERISTSHELAIYLKEAILKEFEQRWSKVEFNHLLVMANLLDPRFKKVHFQDKIACSRTICFVSDAVRELTSQQKESTREFSETPASGKLILMIFTFIVPISIYYDAFIT